jgi:nucleolin
MAAADSSTVYVGGISYNATESEVSEFFSQCGEVLSVRMPTFADSGRSKGIAFVEFADKAGVDAALALSDSDFLGRNIKVDIARGKSDKNERRGGGGGGRDRSQERYGNNRYNKGGYERRNRSPPTSRQPSEPSDSVFIGNLSWSATEQDLQDAFDGCGRIVSVRIPVDRNSGRQKGFGYITFESQDAAKKAIALSGTDVAGRAVRVDYAASRRD